MRWRSKILGCALLFVLAVSSIVMGLATPAKALPNIGPDPDDMVEQSYYGNSYPGVDRQWKYAVSRDGYSDIFTTRLKIYMPTATGTITIADGDLCYNDAKKPGVPNQDADYELGSGNMTKYTMTNTGTGVITRYGVWNGATGCWDNLLTFNVSGSSKDASTGMYPYFLDVDALANGKFLNLFKVNAPAGSYITFDSAIDTTSIGVHTAYPIPPGNNPLSSNPPDPYKVYSTMTMRFGADCSVTANPYRDSVEIYDDDNTGTNYDVQPRQFHTRMLEYDRSGNYIRDLYPKSVMWNSVNHTTPTTDSAGGWDDDLIVSGARYHIVYTTANKRRIRLYYDFDKNLVYRWKIYNVYYDNTLQLKTPADSIYYFLPCQIPDAKLKAGMSSSPAQVSPGQTATFTPSITVSSFKQSFNATCTIQRTLYPPGGGSSSLGAQPCVTTGGSGTIPINANGTITLRGNNYAAPTNLAPGTRVCDAMTITNPTDADYFASAADKTAESCVKIIGHPYLTATNNDVWAGSSFDHSNNQCSGQPARTSAISSWVEGDSGASSEYGVFSLGAVTEFGSANLASLSRLTFANTPGQGTLGAVTRCIPNYFDTVGTSGEAWPGFPAMTTNMGKKVYYSGTSMAMTVGGTVPAGTQVVLVVNGDLTIRGNIQLANNYSSLSNMSSLWVIAKGNIYIQENVTSLQGVFVAQGTSGTPGKIHTCVQTNQIITYSPLTTNVCNNGLDVYGALVADQVYWQRTRGTTTPTQSYAESVQFDPGVYLNSPISTSSSDSQIQDSKELPPIY